LSGIDLHCLTQRDLYATHRKTSNACRPHQHSY
jgi:hypothetical protein